jgi:hypothetical protein
LALSVEIEDDDGIGGLDEKDVWVERRGLDEFGREVLDSEIVQGEVGDGAERPCLSLYYLVQQMHVD